MVQNPTSDSEEADTRGAESDPGKLKSKMHHPVPEVGKWLGKVVQGSSTTSVYPETAIGYVAFAAKSVGLGGACCRGTTPVVEAVPKDR